MKIFVTTIGTRGDVQPHVALAEGLSKAGHTVTVCTSPRYEALVTERGLGYGYLSDDIIALVESSEGRAAIESMASLVSGVRAAVKIGRQTGQIQRDLVRDGWTAAQEADPDLIVYHPKMAAGLQYAEKLGIPAVMAPLYPLFLPTAAYPNLGLPRLNLGRRLSGWYNRATHRLVLKIVSSVSARYYGEWRAAHGLPPQPRGTDAVHTTGGARVPFLNGWSRHVAPDPPDWPGGIETTGYWFLNHTDIWEPPTALEAFLAAGPPPVYVGFGSMAGRRPERTTRAVLDALGRAGLRGVLASGWGGLALGDLPESVYLLDRAPHDWLFPRVAAVVHHGGAGTTAAGLRVGRPTVVCPFFGDQPFWGRRVHELGAGPAPIPQKKLTADRLAAALHEATESLAIRRNAAALGEEIRREDGIANAVAFIERTVTQYSVQLSVCGSLGQAAMLPRRTTCWTCG